jgi:membrane protein required for colicin V production
MDLAFGVSVASSYTPTPASSHVTFAGVAMAIEGYDLMMLGILAAAAVLGYFKGFVWQVAWIAGIAASGFVAVRFAGVVAPFIGQQPPWNRLLAMLALYVATSMVVWLLFRVVSGLIDAIHLSAFDHQLGLLFGLAKGALLCLVITFFAVTLAPGFRGQILGSHSGQFVAGLIGRADEFLPPEIVELVEPFVRQFEDQLGNRNAAGGPSPLTSIWEGLNSAAAWAGAAGPQGQGGGVPGAWGGQGAAAGTPPAAPQRLAQEPTSQFGGGFGQPQQPPAYQPPAYQPPAYGQPNAPQPAGFQQPLAPQPFPIGAQTPLPIR